MTKIGLDILEASILPILDRIHTNPIKKKIKRFPEHSTTYVERLNFSCPMCGDSKKNPKKKRGNLYLDKLRYKCFNCGASLRYLNFLEHFGVDIDFENQLKVIEYLKTVSLDTQSVDSYTLDNLDKLHQLDELTTYFNNDPSSKLKNFSPIIKDSEVYNYLINERKITDHTDIFQGTYFHTDTWKEPVMIFMNMANDKVLGIQIRNIKSDKRRRFFKIVPWSDLNEWLGKEDAGAVEQFGYDKLSYLFNILKIDWDKPVTVFEGFIDTKFFPNSIGMVGTNTDIFFITEQGGNIRFFFDADWAGYKKTIQYLNLEHSVFLWDKLFDFIASKSKSHFHTHRYLKEEIIDLNDLAKFIPNPYKKLKLEEYFSIDRMDSIFIKKPLYKK